MRTLYFDPQSLNQNKLLLPYSVFFSINKAEISPYASSAIKFFGPRTTVAVILHLKDRETPPPYLVLSNIWTAPYNTKFEFCAIHIDFMRDPFNSFKIIMNVLILDGGGILLSV